MSSADLAGAALNLQHLRSDAKARLLSILHEMQGTKCLVIDPALGGPLNIILQAVGSRQMQDEGVDALQELNWADLDTKCDTVVYLVRPNIKLMKQLASQIRSLRQKRSRTNSQGGVHKTIETSFHIIFTPKRSLECEQVLEDESVMAYVQTNLYDYQLGLIPFDNDVLSMEYDNAFHDLCANGDRSVLMYTARALLDLQATFGRIPNIQAKGNWSKSIIDMMLRMQAEATTKEVAQADEKLYQHGGTPFDKDQASGNMQQSQDLAKVLDPASGLQLVTLLDQGNAMVSEIDNLILIDRTVDLITPMCTALTYEALVDEIFGIQNSFVYLEKDMIGGDGSQESNDNSEGKKNTKKEALPLNSNDKLFAEIRDLNITVLMRFLNERAKRMKEEREQLDKRKEVSELHAYVKRLPQMQAAIKSLSTHINITQKISSTTMERSFRAQWHAERSMLEGDNQLAYVEDRIARQDPLVRVLRTICLQSLTSNGIKASRFDAIRRDLIHMYGFEVIFTLNNLEKCGLLKKREGSNTWSSVRKLYKLIVDDVDTSEPKDVAYVTSGYAPLSVRVVEYAISPGWQTKVEALKLLPGATICDVRQPGIQDNHSVANDQNDAVFEEEDQAESDTATGEHARNTGKKIMVVFFVGGVTYAEISALRHLSQRTECPYEIIVASTKIVNGVSMIRSLMHGGSSQ